MLQEIVNGLRVWQSALYSFGLMFLALMVGLSLYSFIFHLLHRAAGQGWYFTDPRMVGRWTAPARVLLPLVVIMIVTPFLPFQEGIQSVLRQVFTLAIIASATWLAINTVLGLQDVILSRYDMVVHDNLKARAVHTQVNVLVKLVLVVLVIVAVALSLMTFSRIRQIGYSILASAGIIGVIAGIAAQRSIANFIAGIQIAIAQPIRIDDVVIMEGEWATVEEITLTYVVLRIWDQRRLVVPILQFLEKPFQNWTRVSSPLLGTVMIHADYTIPVNEMRGELQRILAETPYWNGQTWALQVTDAKERSLELRALVSADNAGNLWELRCHVREKLVEFIRSRHPESLPRIRAELGKQEPSAP